MESLNIAFTAVFPLLFYMLVGWIARVIHITDEPFLKKLNNVTFKLIFPFMVFKNISTMDLSVGIDFGYVIFGAAATILLAVFFFFLIRKTKLIPENTRKSVVIQALFRSNALIFALPVSEAVFGDAGVAASTIMVTILVPIYNVAAVIVLAYFSGAEKPTAGKLIKQVLTNPLILGSIAGAVMLALPFDLPAVVQKPISAIGSVATPLALIVLGGSLKISSVKKNIKVISGCLITKLVLVPLIIWLIMRPFGFTAVEQFAIFIDFATPTALASYSMAAGMGADADLAGELVAFTTITSILTIFLWIVVLL